MANAIYGNKTTPIINDAGPSLTTAYSSAYVDGHFSGDQGKYFSLTNKKYTVITTGILASALADDAGIDWQLIATDPQIQYFGNGFWTEDTQTVTFQSMKAVRQLGAKTQRRFGIGLDTDGYLTLWLEHATDDTPGGMNVRITVGGEVAPIKTVLEATSIPTIGTPVAIQEDFFITSLPKTLDTNFSAGWIVSENYQGSVQGHTHTMVISGMNSNALHTQVNTGLAFRYLMFDVPAATFFPKALLLTEDEPIFIGQLRDGEDITTSYSDIFVQLHQGNLRFSVARTDTTDNSLSGQIIITI
jgi:hypothetical protein